MLALRSVDTAYREAELPQRDTFGQVPGLRYESRLFILNRATRAVDTVEGQQLGSGLDLHTKRLTARAETIERLSCQLRRPDLWETPLRRLKRTALAPEEWALYCQAQYGQEGFPFLPVTSQLPLDWLEARALVDDRPLLVPAQLFMTRRYGRGARILEVTSNGAACHTDRTAALSSALREVIERDAFVRAWHTGDRPKRLSQSRLESPELTSAAQWLEQSGWRVHLRLARGTAAHVVIAGVESTQRRFGLDPGGTLFSAGASGSVLKAAEHAVRELVMFSEALPEVMRRGQIPDLPQMRRTDDVADVWRLYLRPEMRPLIEWFLSGEEVAPPPDVHDDRPEPLIASLGAAGLSPLMVDMSVPRFAPFVAVQAYVPGLLPLTLGTDLARIGPSWRPSDDPAALTWPTDAFQVRDGSFNPYPLPFS